MLTIQNVSYEYAAPDGTLRVLDPLTLNVDRGEVVSLIGPSGCGKTTLLHLIAHLKPLQTGAISINGVSGPEIIARNLYSIIFQEITLLDWLTARKNIELPVTLNPALKYIPVETILAQVGLLPYHHLYPYQLSGGMKTRVSIARSLMANTPLLLMDECFASLDEVTREQMNLMLLSLLEKFPRTMLFITHSILEAVFMSDRVVVFSQKPARIIGDVRIDLPRPRQSQEIETRDYTEYRKMLRAMLNQSNTP